MLLTDPVVDAKCELEHQPELMLRSRLQSLGAEVTAVAGRMVSARIHLNRLPDLAESATLQFARPALATTRAGSVTSQGDPAQR